MTKFHNRYRRAKRFRLDEENEVVDEFCGTRKSHAKAGWDYYDYRGNALWGRWSTKTNRYIASRVGEPWDDVYGSLCRVASHQKPHVARWIMQSIRWKVELNVVVADGKFCDPRRGRKLCAGELYVDPVTGILCRMPASPPKKPREKAYHGWFWEKQPRHYGCKVVKVGDVEYVRKQQEHKFRVAPGVFRTEMVFVWFKYVPYEYKWTATNYVRDAEGNYVKTHEVKTETRYHVYSASKKAIAKHNLDYADI